MAKNGNGNDRHWWDNAWENLPDEWSETETQLFERLLSRDELLANDRLAQALYDEGFFNFDLSTADRVAIRDTLKDYLWDEYEIDFDRVFDWAGYRRAYDTAA